ncbi:MAG: glycosyltransferase [Chloroflexota bacterium]
MSAARPLRVLHLLSGCTVGGCEQHVLSLISGLDRSRFEPWLACFEAEPDEATPMVPMFRAAGARVVDLGASSRNDPRAVARLGALLRRQSFDVIHAHSLRAELAMQICARFAAGRPRLLRGVHNVEDFYNRQPWAALAGWSARRLDRVIAISDAVLEHLVASGRVPREKLERIYYGIDPRPYADIEPPAPDADRPPTLLMIARLAPQKGHRVLFDALPAVLARVPDLVLRVVGHEEMSTRAELEAYARERGVAGAVRFEGFRGDVPSLLEESDCFVLPSMWEGFGLVLLEAMAAARPVVASAVGPIPEIVQDGVTGRLVPAGDAAALATALLEVLESRALGRDMGIAGRARALERFSIETMVDAMSELYERLAGRRDGGSLAAAS